MKQTKTEVFPHLGEKQFPLLYTIAISFVVTSFRLLCHWRRAKRSCQQPANYHNAKCQNRRGIDKWREVPVSASKSIAKHPQISKLHIAVSKRAQREAFARHEGKFLHKFPLSVRLCRGNRSALVIGIMLWFQVQKLSLLSHNWVLKAERCERPITVLITKLSPLGHFHHSLSDRSFGGRL